MEDQEQPVRLDGARGEVVVAVLRVIEVKAAQLLRADESGDDELDVGVRQVVTEVYEALRALAKRLREQQ